MKKPDVSLFIPIFNEESIIDSHIKRIKEIIRKIPENFEIFIVDDASTDKSKQILEQISKTQKDVKHLRYELGPTRRENLAQSFKKANSNIIAMMDIDLSTNLNYLPNLINGIKEGYDIVIGSRYVPGSKIKRSFFRRTISFLYNHFIRFFYGSKLNDHECGFKAFKKEVIFNLLNDLGYDTTLKRGVFWDTEMLIRAQKKGYSIKEIPIEWNESDKSKLRFKREIKMIPYMLKFKFKKCP